MSAPITERDPITGAWHISDIINGARVARNYYGYTKRQAIAEFNADTKKATQ